MYDKKLLENLLKSLKGKIFKDFNLGKLTFFKTGGYVDYLFIPHNTQDMQCFLNNVANDVPLFIIGNGSNLLIRDGGIRGVAIKLSRLNNIKLINNNTIYAESGALDHTLSMFAYHNNIQGFEFLYTIPGTIGGAIVMNAGAYQKEIKDIYINAVVIDRNGLLHNLYIEEADFKYRSSYFKEGKHELIIIGANLKADNKNSKEVIKLTMNRMEKQRQLTQPLASEKTGGSTFKNPLNCKAWELINLVVDKNIKVGGAQISKVHSNFLINNGNATASDIEYLGELIREKVYQKLGVLLEWEIKIVGEYKK